MTESQHSLTPTPAGISTVVREGSAVLRDPTVTKSLTELSAVEKVSKKILHNFAVIVCFTFSFN